MNKKNLSVVLAGAMLATSVAPVLADTTAKEYSIDNIASLKKEILDLMETKMITTNSTLVKDSGTNAFVADAVAQELKANQSAYGIKVLNVAGDEVDLDGLSTTITSATTVTYDTDAVKEILDNTDLKAGYTIKVVERATSEFHGQLIPGSKITEKSAPEKYVKDDFSDANIAVSSGKTYLALKADASNNELVDTIGNNTDKDQITITTKKVTDYADSNSVVTKTLSVGDEKLDGRLPLDEKGNLLDLTKKEDVQKFDHFETLKTYEVSKAYTKAPEVRAEYKLTGTADVNRIKASDLYDGVALTAKGTELLSELKNAASAVDSTVEKVTDAIGSGKTDDDKALVKLSAFSTSTSKPVYTFTISYYKNATDAAHDNGNGQNPYKVITVNSTDKDEMNALYKLLKKGEFNVGIVGGANRYATAVNVAKANETTVAADGNIVLVNGNSLVDGLSAAPLAASLGNKAPVLLSKADSLPEETKEYIGELTKGITNKKSVTINLVGGESVLSSSLVKELEDMGFYVKRFGGSNREATSLAVAKEIVDTTKNTNDAFVVGGNGEADAMAISAVAAKDETPIIVSSVHGLSESALSYLNEKSAKGDVTIVGGTSVVSESEEEAINESLTLNKASRIAGENRFETNAKIIKEYYKSFPTNTGAEAVVLVKDGVAKKSDLVDALAAANYASENNAPIVLATSSLNAAQKNALLNMDITNEGTSTKTMVKAVQVGEGVERPVLEAVAGLFGLSNK